MAKSITEPLSRRFDFWSKGPHGQSTDQTLFRLCAAIATHGEGHRRTSQAGSRTMFQRPLNQTGVGAMEPEWVEALRGSPRLALDVRQCEPLGSIDFFEGGPLLWALVASSSEPDDQFLRKAIFGGRPLARPMARYAVLEPHELSELAARFPTVSLRKLKRRLEALADSTEQRPSHVELAVESVQDCVRFFREHAKKGHALLQWNEKWKEGLRYRPDPALAAVVGSAPRQLEPLIRAFNTYVRRKRLVDAAQQLTPDEALSAVLGKRKRKHLELDFEVIQWLRPHLEPQFRAAAKSRSRSKPA